MPRLEVLGTRLSNGSVAQTLDADLILATVQRLERRIRERFPDAHLGDVALSLVLLARAARARSRALRRPVVALRIVSWVLALGIVGLIASIPFLFIGEIGSVRTVLAFVQVLEPTLGSLFFVGAILAYLVSVEHRVKRARALHAVHELRAMAHIIDMHQLTKDPELVIASDEQTPSSPARTYTAFELGRYFDYCSEMLAHLSKIGALYIQGFPDPVAVSAVDEIENLTTGLSRKVWQKIMILEMRTPASRLAGD